MLNGEREPSARWLDRTGRFLEGRVALVTGAGRGVGREAAVLLSRAGARVAILARTRSEIIETAERIRAEGSSVHAFAADVSDWSAMCKVAQEVEQHLGAVELVVANASVIEPIGDAWAVDAAAWAQNVGVNLTGAFFTARAFLPGMVKRNEGTLIFISSGAATHPAPGWGAYAASKAGMEYFAHNLAAELAQRGIRIRVHILYPGVVDTAMQETIRSTEAEAFPLVGKYRQYHERGWLRPAEEPALAILWMAGPWSADLHDKTVSVDDLAIRKRIAEELGIKMFKGRGE